MAARRLTFASSDLSLPEAKQLARRAYSRARGSGGLAPIIVDRLWSETLMAVDGQSAEAAAEKLRRTEHLMVLLEDRGRWIASSFGQAYRIVRRYNEHG